MDSGSSSLQDRYQIVQGYEPLNQLACSLIEKGTESKEVLITTLEGRWLGTGQSDPPLSEAQSRLRAKLDLLIERRVAGAPALDMKILLLDNPSRLHDPWQVGLLARSGAAVKFIRTTSRLRLVLSGSEVLLAVSTHSNSNTIVNTGLYYRAATADDVVVSTIRTLFMRYFDRAVPVEVDQKGQLELFTLARRELVLSLKSISPKDWVLLVTGGFIGVLASLLASYIYAWLKP